MKPTFAKLAAAFALAATSATALAADADANFPNRPVHVIVGFAPGGGVDLMARAMSKKLSEQLGQTFIVENRPGAGGTIATADVAQAKPDGHTLLMTSVAHAINQSLYKDLAFDSVKDFVAVTPIARGPNGIAVHPAAPFNTLAELVAYAKANPGKVSYGAIGGATTMHLGMALFANKAGIDLLYVPFNGTMASVNAAVAGHVDMVSSGYGSAEPFAREGRLKMLAMSLPERSELAPGVPTVAEAANLPDYDVTNWMGFYAPAGTPQPVVEKLNKAIREALASDEIRQYWANQKLEPFALDPQAFQELTAREVEKYAEVVKLTGATAN